MNIKNHNTTIKLLHKNMKTRSRKIIKNYGKAKKHKKLCQRKKKLKFIRKTLLIVA